MLTNHRIDYHCSGCCCYPYNIVCNSIFWPSPLGCQCHFRMWELIWWSFFLWGAWGIFLRLVEPHGYRFLTTCSTVCLSLEKILLVKNARSAIRLGHDLSERLWQLLPFAVACLRCFLIDNPLTYQDTWRYRRLSANYTKWTLGILGARKPS